MPSIPPAMESAEYSVDDSFAGDRLYRTWAGYFNHRGETIMVRGKRLLLGWAALMLLSGPAFADDSYYAKADGPSVRSASAAATTSNRRVQIWRGDPPPMAPAPPQLAQATPGLSQLPGDVVDNGFTLRKDQPEEIDSACDSEGPFCDANCGNGCCTPFWAHRTSFFGEYLYLRPRGIDMAHAMQQNGVGGPGTVPDGRVGVLNPQFAPAFRLGFWYALDNCSSIGASYTNFRNHVSDTLIAPDGLGGTVQSLVLHPNSVNAGSTSSLVN